MSKIKNYLERVLILSPLIIMALLIVGVIILTIFVFATYGDKPISEVPAWAFLLMQSGSK